MLLGRCLAVQNGPRLLTLGEFIAAKRRPPKLHKQTADSKLEVTIKISRATVAAASSGLELKTVQSATIFRRHMDGKNVDYLFNCMIQACLCLFASSAYFMLTH